MNSEPRQGLMFIVSGPSGAGKTTVASAALRAFPDMIMSVSSTTRAPRDRRLDGVEYRFVDDAALTVQRRLENACREIARAAEYNHVIVNRSRDEAIAEFEAIVTDARRFGANIPRCLGGMNEAELDALLESFG